MSTLTIYNTSGSTLGLIGGSIPANSNKSIPTSQLILANQQHHLANLVRAGKALVLEDGIQLTDSTIDSLTLASSTVESVKTFIGPSNNVLHVYSDAQNGSDDYSGLYPDRAKRKPQAAMDLIPYFMNQSAVVHLNGNYTEAHTSGMAYVFFRCEKNVGIGKYLFIDGGNNWYTIKDNSGSPYVSDIATTSTIGKTGAGWTVNAYRGYVVTLLDGPKALEHRLIVSNTADTITPIKSWSVAPINTQFRISRFGTSISINNTPTTLTPYFGSTGMGWMCMERLNFGGNKLYLIQQLQPFSNYYSHITLDPSYTDMFCINNAFSGGITPNYYILDSNGERITDTLSCCGIGAANQRFYCRRATSFYIYASVFKYLEVYATLEFYIRQGTSTSIASLISDLRLQDTSFVSTSTGYAKSSLGALSFTDCALLMGECDISNQTGNAIGLNNSSIQITSVITGTGNTGFGINCTNGSKILTKSGSVPTLTGTSGDIAVNSVNKTTWANLHAVGRITDADELVLLKKYT